PLLSSNDTPDDKILIDCTNPILPGMEGLKTEQNTSCAEEIADAVENWKVVKAFNTVGSSTLTNTDFNGIQADTLICGNNKDAKAVVAQLAAEIGFNPIDVGMLEQARYLEALAMLWINMAYKYGFGQDISFKLLRKEG
ncbi:MAG: F420-dependent NADP oxidoreductase, partial [Bacteroidetes bacterium]|nr:F420-dependent NADP oxidoreductase [Bacteroidota bacterium]